MSRLCDKQLRRWFGQFNDRYHDGRLPDVDVLYAPLDRKCALAEWEKNEEIIITINPAFALDHNIAKIQLHHEMAHIASGVCHHGKRFDAEIGRLFVMGAYKGLL